MSELSNKELLDAIMGVDRAIHAVDLRLTQTETLIVQYTDVRKDHEDRIRSLEFWIFRVVPMVAIALEIVRKVFE